jgi:hypothetical protein
MTDQDYVTELTDEVMTAVLSDLNKDGYAIIPSIMSRKRTANLLTQWYEIMDGMTNGAIRNGQCSSTFRKTTQFPNDAHGILTDKSIGQNGVSWATRTDPNVMKFFQQFWGAPHVITSYDRVNYQPPGLSNTRLQSVDANGKFLPEVFEKKQVTWLHVDQLPIQNQWSFCGIQTYVDLIGTEGEHGMDAGCLVCCPNSHKFDLPKHVRKSGKNGLYNTKAIEAILKKKPKKNGPSYGFYKFTDDERTVLFKGLPWKRIVSLRNGSPIPPGSMVIWDSRTFHQGSHSIGPMSRTRCVVYVNMEPASSNPNPNHLKKRLTYFEDSRTCSHSPNYGNVFGNPRTYGNDNKRNIRVSDSIIQKPLLNDSIRVLIGIKKPSKTARELKRKKYYKQMFK